MTEVDTLLIVLIFTPDHPFFSIVVLFSNAHVFDVRLKDKKTAKNIDQKSDWSEMRLSLETFRPTQRLYQYTDNNIKLTQYATHRHSQGKISEIKTPIEHRLFAITNLVIAKIIQVNLHQL